MKWFTREWQNGELSESEYDAVWPAYLDHIAELRPSLPEGLRRLVEGGGSLSLHDGWFIDVLGELESPNTVLLHIRSADRAGGRLVENVWIDPMLHVRIRYHEAKLIHPEWDDLRAGRGSGVILYGELDRCEGNRFAHRMLLWPETAGYVSVEFGSAELAAVRFDGPNVDILET